MSAAPPSAPAAAIVLEDVSYTYPGAERPLMREPHVAGKFHGENGLGDVELPLPDTAPESTFAWGALYATAKRMPGELRLVATGPLTNVAIALTK